MRSPHGKGANNNAVGLDNDKDNNNNNFRNGSQSSGSESLGSSDFNASAAANNRRLYKEHRRV